MEKVGFFTPIDYGSKVKTHAEKATENVDSYFHVFGKKAYVVSDLKAGKRVVVLKKAPNSALTILKTTAAVLSFFTVVIPLMMLAVKTILRAKHSYKLIDPKAELEKGIDVPQTTIGKIQSLLPQILNANKDPEIEWLSTGNNLVFKLKDSPEFVFKFATPKLHYVDKNRLPKGRNEDTRERYENMLKAKEVCLAYELGLLIIPSAKKLVVEGDGNQYEFIAERSLDFNPKTNVQEENYIKFSLEMNETVKQLATFIAKTGFNDVTHRNIPILNEADGFQGPRRVALIDLEHMEHVLNGFIGDKGFIGNGSCGLIHCISEEHIDIVIDEATRHGIVIDPQVKAERLLELESNRKLQQFYKDKGIKTGKEELQVNLADLGLNLEEKETWWVPVSDIVDEEKEITLRQVAEDLVKRIKDSIKDQPEGKSIKETRSILLNTNEHRINLYKEYGTKEGRAWLYRIIDALIAKGHLFKLVKEDGHGILIQA